MASLEGGHLGFQSTYFCSRWALIEAHSSTDRPVAIRLPISKKSIAKGYRRDERKKVTYFMKPVPQVAMAQWIRAL